MFFAAFDFHPFNIALHRNIIEERFLGLRHGKDIMEIGFDTMDEIANRMNDTLNSVIKLAPVKGYRSWNKIINTLRFIFLQRRISLVARFSS